MERLVSAITGQKVLYNAVIEVGPAARKVLGHCSIGNALID